MMHIIVIYDRRLIPYQNIRVLEKCSQGIAPIGIAITYENMEGKTVTDKLFLMFIFQFIKLFFMRLRRIRRIRKIGICGEIS